MNNDTVFISTSRNSRSGLSSTIRVITFEDVLNTVSEKPDAQYYYGMMFGNPHDIMKGLGSLSLGEFEQMFPNHSKLTPRQVTRHFCKAVSEEYGEHAVLKKSKLKPSQVIAGQIYEDSKTSLYLYLGRVSGKEITSRKNYSYGNYSQNATYQTTTHDLDKVHAYVRINGQDMSKFDLDNHLTGMYGRIEYFDYTKTKRPFYKHIQSDYKLPKTIQIELDSKANLDLTLLDI